MIKVPVCSLVVCGRPGDAYRYCYYNSHYNSEDGSWIHCSYLKLFAQCSAAARRGCRGVGYHQKDTEDMQKNCLFFNP